MIAIHLTCLQELEIFSFFQEHFLLVKVIIPKLIIKELSQSIASGDTPRFPPLISWKILERKEGLKEKKEGKEKLFPTGKERRTWTESLEKRQNSSSHRNSSGSDHGTHQDGSIRARGCCGEKKKILVCIGVDIVFLFTYQCKQCRQWWQTKPQRPTISVGEPE